MKVFISHSSKDKPFVRKLKRDLELNYIESWLDEDELLPGDSLIEKLNSALKSSTHLMIILSPNSVKSDWVKYELENALKYVEEETLSKIIPIHYRKCKIPDVLKPILNIDLTNEIVYMRHGEMEFLNNEYYQCLNPLVRSINQGERKLETSDKNEITGKEPISYPENEKMIALHYRIIGYKSISKFLANQIPPDVLQNYHGKDISELRPVILPRQLSTYFGDLKFGDSVTFINNEGKTIEGEFARYSTQNNRIVIPKIIRDFVHIKQIGDHKVTINLGSKAIKIEEIT